MKAVIKSLSLTVLLFSAFMLVTGCNTVQGAFQGAGRDTSAVVHGLHLNNPPRHHTVYKKHTTRVMTTKTTTTTSPSAVQATPDVAQPQ